MSTTQPPSPSVVLGAPPAADPIYATAGTSAALVPGAVSPSGGGAAHENRQPSLAITYIISLFGIYPGGVEAGDGRRLTLVAVEVPRIPRADPPARVGFTLVLRGDPSPVTPEGALDEPRRLGLPARVTVLMTNAASLGLCERLGFVRRNETPPFVELEWRPGP